MTQSRQASPRELSVEIVIVCPNIEHCMPWIILGLGGNDLGNTLWGQTELSMYEDSMHCVWGMSYKYHKSSIVFNKKNLIRLWDMQYQGYIRGKDYTFADRTSDAERKKFLQSTLDVTKNYSGQCMMVMAFVHSNKVMQQQLRWNWPSPIVLFYY